MKIKKTFLFYTIFLFLSLSSVCGQSIFTANGFECEMMRDSTLIISRKPCPYFMEENIDSVFRIPSAIEYEGKTYQVSRIAQRGFAGNADIKHLVIDEGIKQIHEEAFSSCINLQSIRIPASIVNIEELIFDNCYNLESIIVDPANEDYDSRDNCNAIIETGREMLIAACFQSRIPSGIATIGVGAFTNCLNLQKITIPEGITRIEDLAFSECENLESISLPQSLEYVGQYVFRGCTSLQSIIIPKNVKKIIYGGLFCNCNQLKSLAVEAGNKVYDSRQNCNAIIETENNKLVTACVGTRLVEGIQEIGEHAFEGLPLYSVHIPQTVMKIGHGAFFQCNKLMSITVDEKNPFYTSPTGSNAILSKDTKTLVLGCAGTVIPEGIVKIGKCAFSGNEVPTKTLFLPEGIKVIREFAFSQCSNLQMVVIPSSVESIEDWAFSSCPNLNIVQFKGGSKNIDSSAFFNSKRLAVVDLPKGITTIGYSTFAGCTNLHSVSIPSSLIEIRHGAFEDCPCEKEVLQMIQKKIE